MKHPSFRLTYNFLQLFGVLFEEFYLRFLSSPSKRPLRGPTIQAPTNAIHPPATWITVEPVCCKCKISRPRKFLFQKPFGKMGARTRLAVKKTSMLHVFTVYSYSPAKSMTPVSTRFPFLLLAHPSSLQAQCIMTGDVKREIKKVEMK